MNTTHIRMVLGAVGLMGLLGGCATGPAPADALTPQTPEQVVSERALTRWNALIKGDDAQAYQYYQPLFRSTFSPENVKQADGATPAKGARVREVACQPERCSVSMIFKVQAPVGRGRSMEIEVVRDEAWVRQNGQWWYERQGL